MVAVPERIGVAGDWHGNTAWAVRAVGRMAGLLPEGGPRLIVQLGDFGIWPGSGGQEYLATLDAALDEKNVDLWFVDGNHEDHTMLAQLRPGPDGKARMTRRIWHLPRGYRWHWHGRQWLALGGAVSLDRAVRTAGHDWWPGEEISYQQAVNVVRAGPADVMVTHDCPAGVEHSFPPPPSHWASSDLRRNEAHREMLREVVLAVKPQALIHGHLHLSYRRRVDLGAGPVELTGLDCDGAEHSNWGILDITEMRWVRFHGRLLSDTVRNLASRGRG